MNYIDIRYHTKVPAVLSGNETTIIDNSMERLKNLVPNVVLFG